MSATPIDSVDDVYRFVERLRSEAKNRGAGVLVQQLDDALLLGSSGLEILGGIRGVMIEHRQTIEQVLGAVDSAQSGKVIAFVDKAFGRQ
jgi:hypothetical protein